MSAEKRKGPIPRICDAPSNWRRLQVADEVVYAVGEPVAGAQEATGDPGGGSWSF